mmetsp:Transcript_97117/g.308078  ORF Transcript_97117/g.308078 Transcript_97117/m.308078 type:complete len:335 (+) Transcript_97117:51-1055(+)
MISRGGRLHGARLWSARCSRGSAGRSASSAHGVAVLSQAQWQGEGGANAQGIVRGCRIVSQVLAELLPHAERLAPPAAPPPAHAAGGPATASGIRHHGELSRQAAAAVAALDASAPSAVVTAGGDCSVDLAPCGWLSRRHGGDMAVLYVDAHADLNSQEETPSGHFHGMVLRALLGDAPHGLAPARPVEPASVVLAGLRELDAPEEAAIRRLGMAALPPAALREDEFASLLARLSSTGRRRLHIHLDLDVLDPAEFPHVSVPSPGGLGVGELRRLLRAVGEALPLAGLTVTEARPLDGPGEAAVSATVLQLLGPGGLDISSRLAAAVPGGAGGA